MDIPASVIDLIRHALEEDIGHGDITTSLIVPPENISRALYIAKGNFVLSGFPFARTEFSDDGSGFRASRKKKQTRKSYSANLFSKA